MKLTSVTIGCSRPHQLARFYAHLLGRMVTADEPAGPDDGGWAQIRPQDGEEGPTLNFEYERNFTRPVWPSVPGNQNATQHLDIQVSDLEAAVEWAVKQGATVAQFQPQERVRVLFDPEGHPFCLFC